MTVVAEPAVPSLLGWSDAVLRNERKLSQGPAVRFADRRHPLRRGPDGRHRARLCHQSGWSGMRLQVVERATATLLVGENSSKPLDES